MIWKKQETPIPTVKELDLMKYLGLWFEIGKLPQREQRQLTHVTARGGSQGRDIVEGEVQSRERASHRRCRNDSGNAHRHLLTPAGPRVRECPDGVRDTPPQASDRRLCPTRNQ